MIILLLVSISFSKTLYLNTNNCTSIEYEKRIYINTVDGGLISYEPSESTWIFKNSVNGLNSNTSKKVEVHNDSIWVLSSGGLSIFNDSLNLLLKMNFNPLLFNDTLPETFTVNDSLVILGGETGLQWFEKSQIENLNQVLHKDHDFHINTILNSDTCIFLGTLDGIFKTKNLTDTVRLSSRSTFTMEMIDGDLWAGGYWGCKNITEDTSRLSNVRVRSIDEIDDELYASTDSGLYKYDSVWSRINSEKIYGICKPENYGSIFYINRETGFVSITLSDTIDIPGINSNECWDLTQTPDGNLYAIHRYDYGISRFDGEYWQTLNQNNEWGFYGRLNKIESDSRGVIYFGLWYWYQVDIVFKWNPDKDSMPVPVDLPVDPSTIGTMLVDSDDNLWISAFSGDNDWILKMERVENGTDSLEWTIYTSPSIRWVRVFTEMNNTVYGGNSPPVGGAGIHIFTPEGDVEEVLGNLGSSTVSMAADIDGSVWAGLENNLVHIENNEVSEAYDISNSELLSNQVDDIIFDFQGGMWCYHSGKGLSYRSPDGSNWENIPGFSSIVANDVPEVMHFTSDNKLIICTYNGIYKLDIDFNIPDNQEDEYTRTNVYPNPINLNKNSYLFFASADLEGKKVMIFNVYGKLEAEYVTDEQVLRIAPDLKSGLYIYVVKDGNEVLDKGRFTVIR